jgi:hypothetical protein
MDSKIIWHIQRGYIYRHNLLDVEVKLKPKTLYKKLLTKRCYRLIIFNNVIRIGKVNIEKFLKWSTTFVRHFYHLKGF